MKNKTRFKQIKRVRKAQISTTIEIIIILVALLVLLAFYGVWDKYLKPTSAKEICRLSAFAKANTRLPESPVNLQCYTQYVNVKSTGIYKNDKRIYPTTNEDTIKKIIASEMYDCWYQFLMGKQNPFSSVGSGEHCVVCSQITFDNNLPIDAIPDLESELNKQLKGIVEYPSGTTIETKGTYFVTYQVKKPNGWETMLESTVTCAAVGAAVAAVPGAAVGGTICFVGSTIAVVNEKYVPGILLTNSAEFSKTCDSLY